MWCVWLMCLWSWREGAPGGSAVSGFKPERWKSTDIPSALLNGLSELPAQQAYRADYRGYDPDRVDCVTVSGCVQFGNFPTARGCFTLYYST